MIRMTNPRRGWRDAWVERPGPGDCIRLCVANRAGALSIGPAHRKATVGARLDEKLIFAHQSLLMHPEERNNRRIPRFAGSCLSREFMFRF